MLLQVGPLAQGPLSFISFSWEGSQRVRVPVPAAAAGPVEWGGSRELEESSRICCRVYGFSTLQACHLGRQESKSGYWEPSEENPKWNNI